MEIRDFPTDIPGFRTALGEFSSGIAGGPDGNRERAMVIREGAMRIRVERMKIAGG
jgi:hypothetical protein